MIVYFLVWVLVYRSDDGQKNGLKLVNLEI